MGKLVKSSDLGSGVLFVQVELGAPNEGDYKNLYRENEEMDYFLNRIEDLQKTVDKAYTERNQLVRFLASVFPSGIKKTSIPGWSEEWHNCVYIDTPYGQMSWHFHDKDKRLFEHLPPYNKEWDGHTTEKKYILLEELGNNLHNYIMDR